METREKVDVTPLTLWRRPKHLQQPRVWLREEGVVVRDLTPDFYPFVLEHMKEFFLRDEPVNKAAGAAHDAGASFEICLFWEKLILSQGVSLVALPEGSPGANLEEVGPENPPDIIGVNQLIVVTKDDPPWPQDYVKSDIVKRSIFLFAACGSLVNIFERFGVDTYMDGYGLSVVPSWRRKGIGPMMVRAREALCRAIGITVIKAIFTNSHSQKMAAKSGFELLGELNFADIKTADGRQLYPEMPPEQKKIQLTAKRIFPVNQSNL